MKLNYFMRTHLQRSLTAEQSLDFIKAIMSQRGSSSDDKDYLFQFMIKDRLDDPGVLSHLVDNFRKLPKSTPTDVLVRVHHALLSSRAFATLDEVSSLVAGMIPTNVVA